MEQALEQAEPVAYGELNREFHELIFAWSPYPRLVQMNRSLWDGNSGLRSVFGLAPERLEASHLEHREILDRIKAGDAEGAGALALRHKQTVADALVAALQSQHEGTDSTREARGERRNSGLST